MELDHDSRTLFAKAFTEWERRYRKDPAGYMSADDCRAAELKTHGDASADYFVKMILAANPL